MGQEFKSQFGWGLCFRTSQVLMKVSSRNGGLSEVQMCYSLQSDVVGGGVHFPTRCQNQVTLTPSCNFFHSLAYFIKAIKRDSPWWKNTYKMETTTVYSNHRGESHRHCCIPLELRQRHYLYSRHKDHTRACIQEDWDDLGYLRHIWLQVNNWEHIYHLPIYLFFSSIFSLFHFWSYCSG